MPIVGPILCLSLEWGWHEYPPITMVPVIWSAGLTTLHDNWYGSLHTRSTQERSPTEIVGQAGGGLARRFGAAGWPVGECAHIHTDNLMGTVGINSMGTGKKISVCLH